MDIYIYISWKRIMRNALNAIVIGTLNSIRTAPFILEEKYHLSFIEKFEKKSYKRYLTNKM